MSKEVRDIQDQKDQEQEEVKGVAEEQEPQAKISSEATEEQETEDNRIEEMEQRWREMNDKYLRLSAEFDNYRKRTLKEKTELIKSAGERILGEILPVMDNFERALQSMETATDVPALREGVELIYSTFKDFLTQQGVQEMECIHAEFNPDLQEAVTKIPAPTEEMKGKVVDCIQKGYTLYDKVIRFPKVVVGE
jgi:molecular chaperone GrpE